MYYYGRERQRRNRRKKKLILIASTVLISIAVSSFYYLKTQEVEHFASVDPTDTRLQAPTKLPDSAFVSAIDTVSYQHVDTLEADVEKSDMALAQAIDETEKLEVTVQGQNKKSKTEYQVISKAHFYGLPDKQTQRIASINHWNNSYASIIPLKEKNGYIYVNFKNHVGTTTKGWLRKIDLKKVTTKSYVSHLVKTGPVRQPTLNIKVNDSAARTIVDQKTFVSVTPISEDALHNILDEVKKTKVLSASSNNCVSIKIINRINTENGAIIATYLRRNGFVISGREVVPGSQKGIQVNAGGTCIKLAIGDLY